jgi:hypothetical protein
MLLKESTILFIFSHYGWQHFKNVKKAQSEINAIFGHKIRYQELRCVAEFSLLESTNHNQF